MAIIKSGVASGELKVDATTNAARVTLYDTVGAPINYAETFRGVAATFRILGSAGVPQNIFTIENLSGSGKLVYLRRLELFAETTAALLTVACQVDTSRATGIPTGGTVLGKGALDTALSSSANVILRGANASDGGVATAIAATAAPGYISRGFIPRQATAVGQAMTPNRILLVPDPLLQRDSPLLQENQAIVVQITGTAASNAATNHYIVVCAWDEV